MNPEDEIVEQPLDTSTDTSVENTEVEGVEAEPVSMEDTLRAKYRELTAAPEEKPAAEEKPADDRARGPDGKFIPKTEETPKVEEKPAAVVPPTDTKVEEKPAVTPPAATEKAPSSWSAKGQAAWVKADPDLRAEVAKRENDFHQGLEKYRKESELFRQMDAEIRPYEAMIRAKGTNGIAVIKDALNMAYRLDTGRPEEKVHVLLELANQYGADLTLIPSIQEKLSSGTPIVSPEFTQLQNQFQQLRETLTQRDAREKQEREAHELREREEIQRELTTWSSTKPHYEAVKLSMAALLESGQAKDFDDAYNKASWAHPEVRATLIAEQQAADRKQAAEKAAAAKKASSTNVRTRGTPPAKPANKVGTMEDTLRDAYKKLTQA